MKKIFGMNFYDKNINELVGELGNIITANKKSSVFTPNVDHVINNFEDKKVFEMYSSSEYIIADGWPLVAVSKMKKKPIFRITGVDLMDELLGLANSKGYSVFFLGATDDTLMKLKENIYARYKGIKNIGIHNGYFKNDVDVINKINSENFNIVFVGMGNPKQEIWIRKNIHKLNCNIMLGIGGALKIFSEEVDRAPQWVQKVGMEWFYRFLKEPKRLFSRYFIKYPKFIRILLDEIRG